MGEEWQGWEMCEGLNLGQISNRGFIWWRGDMDLLWLKKGWRMKGTYFGCKESEKGLNMAEKKKKKRKLLTLAEMQVTRILSGWKEGDWYLLWLRGEWHRGSVGDVVAMKLFLWPGTLLPRRTRLNSFCNVQNKTLTHFIYKGESNLQYFALILLIFQGGTGVHLTLTSFCPSFPLFSWGSVSLPHFPHTTVSRSQSIRYK